MGIEMPDSSAEAGVLPECPVGASVVETRDELILASSNTTMPPPRDITETHQNNNTTPHTASTPQHLTLGIRPQGQHLFHGNEAFDDALMLAGDWYTGNAPRGAQGHNYIANLAHGNSTVVIGSTDSTAFLKLMRDRRVRRQNKSARERETGRRNPT